MDAVDALSDLMIGESVYQVIQGNTARAGMTVDAINRGAVLPEPDVARTHRSGTALAHRLLALIRCRRCGTGAGLATHRPARGRRTAHSTHGPGRLLGDPARVTLRVALCGRYIDARAASTFRCRRCRRCGRLSATDVLYDSNARSESVFAL